MTACALSFGGLLLFGGKLADLPGRKVMFLAGLADFAAASAAGGAATSSAMLSLLATTFSDPDERGKTFGVDGAVAAGGGAVGLLPGGVLTEYLS